MAKLTPEEMQRRKDTLKELARYRQEVKDGVRPSLNGPAPVKELVRDWIRLRPEMVKRLRRMGILEEYARVCLERRDDKLAELRKVLYITDAQEEADQCLLRWDESLDEPQEEKPDMEALLDVLERVNLYGLDMDREELRDYLENLDEDSLTLLNQKYLA